MLWLDTGMSAVNSKSLDHGNGHTILFNSERQMLVTSIAVSVPN